MFESEERTWEKSLRKEMVWSIEETVECQNQVSEGA